MASDSLSQSERFSSVGALTSKWCHSKCETTKVNFEWTVDRLSSWRVGTTEAPDVGVLSANFSAKETPEIKWVLYYQERYLQDIEIIPFLYKDHDIDLTTTRPPNPYPVRVQMSILNKKREQTFKRDRVLFRDDSSKPFLTLDNKSQDFFESNSESIQMDGSLIIFCEIHSLVKKETLSGMITRVQHPPFDCSNQLVCHLEELFESRIFSDFTINVGNFKFEVHKSILAARSPVFAAMFAHPTKENSDNNVEIKNVEPNVFLEVLRFIYTGRVPLKVMENIATALLVAADRYLLHQLKKESENHLIHRMSAVNCLELFALTTHHPAEHLKANAVNFFRRFPAKVMATKGWKEAKQENAVWLFELMELVLVNMVS